MRKNNNLLIRRGLWYIVGLFLFIAPFAFYQKGLLKLLNLNKNADIHAICFRMPILDLLTGKLALTISVGFISLILLIISAFIWGPVFCGRLCATGALPEYLSRIIPNKFKIDWSKTVNPTPIRYGFFFGYLIAPFLGSSIACSFCNFSFMQKLIDGGLAGNIGVLGSTTIITAFLWLIPFGLFTKGGRGFCNFLCPVGAFQNAIHSLSSKLGFTYKLKYAREKCTSCSLCVKSCPMGSLNIDSEGLKYQIHNCIVCGQCTASCPKEALSYGNGKSGWEDIDIEDTNIPSRSVL